MVTSPDGVIDEILKSGALLNLLEAYGFTIVRVTEYFVERGIGLLS